MILKNRNNLVFVHKDLKDKKFCLSEVNEKYKIIKTQKIPIDDFSQIFCYGKTVYFPFDNNIAIYY